MNLTDLTIELLNERIDELDFGDECLDCGGDCDEPCGIERWSAPLGQPSVEVNDLDIDREGLAI